MKLSIVVPCYNEEGNVNPFSETVYKTFKNKKIKYEIIMYEEEDIMPSISYLFKRICSMNYKAMFDRVDIVKEKCDKSKFATLFASKKSPISG